MAGPANASATAPIVAIERIYKIRNVAGSLLLNDLVRIEVVKVRKPPLLRRSRVGLE